MRFKVGDYVETNDGKVGYISHICYCDRCRERGFFEPTIKYTDGSEDYISNYAAPNIKNEYKRIGKYSFEIKGWSEWKLARSGERSEDGRNIIIQVRENGKKVQVKGSGYKAEATCCNGDRFDLNKGFELARLRWVAKWHQGKAEKYAKSL